MLTTPISGSSCFTYFVNAETWYLLIGKESGIVAVPMESEEQCEQAGEEVTTFKEWKDDGKVWFVVNCIKGK